jgi:hypothetical protein
MRQRLLATIIVAAALIPTSAYAETQTNDPTATGHGILSGDGHLVVGVSDSSPGEPAKTPVVGTITYKTTTDDSHDPGDISGLCFVDAQHHIFGWAYRIIGTTLDGRVVIDEIVCVPFDPTNRPQPPALPRLPTIAEAWSAANVPPPRIATDPAIRGITGLPTHITPASPMSLTIAATVRGYTITGTATLDHFLVSIDDAPPQTTNDFTFTTKGTHIVVVAAVWHGRATLTGPGLDHPITIDEIGVATIGTTRRYPVHEVRAVLHP